MASSRVRLPRGVRAPYTVFVNGVRQEEGRDYRVESGALVFQQELSKEGKLGFWRWFWGAWGIGTYRKDDQVDVAWDVDRSPPSGTQAAHRAGMIAACGTNRRWRIRMLVALALSVALARRASPRRSCGSAIFVPARLGRRRDRRRLRRRGRPGLAHAPTSRARSRAPTAADERRVRAAVERLALVAGRPACRRCAWSASACR